ncbi:MAG: RNA methyltransferase [Myxococcota bacterium]|nr:RNA methyltransferase [Myxococcota bacterium]
MPILVDSSDDPRLDDFRDVKDAALRLQQGLFLVEGRRNIEVLARQGRFTPRSVLLTQAAFDAMRDTWAVLPASLPIYLGGKALIEEVVGYDLHRGCLAAAQRRDEDGPEEITRRGRLVVVAEDLTDVDNLGSLFRNALALGAGGLLLSPRCCDPLYRKAVRVSLGAVLRLPYARARRWPDGLLALRSAGYALVALDPGPESIALDDFAARAPSKIALIVGTEGPGLSREVRELAEARVRIPMAAGTDSLNVATAAAIAIQRLGLPA